MKTLDVKHIFGSEVFCLMELISNRGFECYIVGGAIRNYFFRKSLSDIDLATSADPDKLIKIFKKEGLEFDERASVFGTLFIKFLKKRFQITSFRKDIKTFGRSAKVLFSRKIIHDAKRRDFTFNAIYCSKEGNIVDPLNSFQDLRDKRLKFIGDAEKRIREDYLRILRFFRFIAELDLKHKDIDQKNLKVISANINNLEIVGRERISQEIKRIFLSKDPTVSLELMNETMIYKKILGSFDKKKIKNLIDLERQLGLSPNLGRRLLSLNIENAGFLLTKKEKKYFVTLKKSLKNICSPEQLGFKLGFEKSLDCLVINAVRNDCSVSGKELSLLEEGSNKIFPLTYLDIKQKLNDEHTAGKKLEYLKNIWVKSDFKISIQKLKNYL